MKHKSMRSWLAVSVLAAAAGHAGIASAHTQIGVLAKRASTSDIYEVTCNDDPVNGTPTRLIVQIQGLLPASSARATAQVEKNSVVVTTTDPKTGDKSPSPEVSNYGGAGTYTVTVGKTNKHGKSPKHRLTYNLDYHCWSDITNLHTDTNLVTIQNQ